MISVDGPPRRVNQRRPWASPATALAALTLGGLVFPGAAHADPVIYPGMEIVQRHPDNEQLSCTLGFVDPTTRVGVTAGHCGGNGPVFANDGTKIGNLAIARSNITPEGQLTRDDYRIDYEGIVFDDGLPINNVLPNGLRLGTDHSVVPRDGLAVCRVGVTTGEACGTVNGIGNGWFLVNGLPVDHGDSGSPVYAITSPGEAAIVGIVSARFTASRTGEVATVALSWPTVQQQIREDTTAVRFSQPDQGQSGGARPDELQHDPRVPDRQAPLMVHPPAPPDSPPTGAPQTVVT